jgi:serine/threonine-protein kinase
VADARAQRLAAVVKSALEAPPETRPLVLERECAGDPALRAEAEGLLAFEDAAFLEEPALNFVAETFAADDRGLAGERLGHYEILSLIARGGMGEVYLAQDHELDRKVAIKLVRRGFGAGNFVRHLRREARILARLNDPHIARLYGGAVTPEGVPFFVMEFVEGERLDRFCKERGLTTNERLELFRKVCSAVAYAHQHLIIHRDLKPANIRVTPDGEPKLLDFGIAKLLDPETTATGAPTITFANVMTPDYASPEQARGDAMTTASDIYSLGVILYELLTGEKPYRVASRNPAEVARAIAESKPGRPSARRRELAGDLDNILLKALRKEPGRRYASVEQFSEDLRRHLAGRPVLAHRDSAAYRAQKFVGRHRGAVAAAALVLLALVGGLATTTWQAHVAREAQRRAEASREQADRLNQFMEDLLATADPAKMGRDGKVVSVLDAASEKLDHEMADQPEILARAHDTLRRAYQHLGLYEQAEKHARAALSLMQRLHGPDDPATAKAEFALGDVLGDRYRQAEAEPLLRHALAVERRQPVPDHAALADTLETLSFVYATQIKPLQAEPLAEQALAEARIAWGEKDARFLRLLNEMATIKVAEQDFPAAAAIFRHLIQLYDKVQPGGLGSVAPQVNLCICLFNEGKFDELEKAADRLQNDTRRLVGGRGVTSAIALTIRGFLCFGRGQDEAAIPFLRDSLATLNKNYPPSQVTVVHCEALLGLCLTRTGHAAEGEPLLRTALANGGAVDRATFDHTFGNIETALGECLLAQNCYAEAEPLLLRGYDHLKKRLGPQNSLTTQAAHRLHDLYVAWNKPAEATRFASSGGAVR